jgi:hypothetical protein|tara:strand:+ start:8508 stop:9476 length:969 start_codon:yes stop_codon:yes gene_type:complete
MKYSLTIFKNTYDNQTHRNMSIDGLDAFEGLLYGMSRKEGQKGGSNSSVLISPSTYTVGTTRSNKNVTDWGGWAALDVDEYLLPDILDYASEHELVQHLKRTLEEKFGEYYYICYSTASSRMEQPKFRLVFPLTKEVEVKVLPHFWFALNREFDELGDKQTKDVSRMYYVPAQYPNALNFIFTNQGVITDPEMLMEKHSYIEPRGSSFMDRLPLELQQAVIAHRKGALNNTDYKWTSYRDCPFWPRQLGIDYQRITGTGWYHKMYQIMVSVGGNAVKRGYPITAVQVAELCKQFDVDNGNWYDNRPLDKEADRALEYIYRNG